MVLDGNPSTSQFVPDAVGGGEVSCVSRMRAIREQDLDEGRDRAALHVGSRGGREAAGLGSSHFGHREHRFVRGQGGSCIAAIQSDVARAHVVV